MDTPPTTLGPDHYDRLDTRLAPWDEDLARRYPGDDGSRQPVHTVYVPAHRYHAGLPAEWGATAASCWPSTPRTRRRWPAIVGIPVDLAEQVAPRLAAKLAGEPIEDLRIDFEDGYGPRPDAEEDADAARAAGAGRRRAAPPGHAPPYMGIRMKCMEAASARRGIRTLDIFLTGLAAAGGLPEGLVLTLPKVTVRRAGRARSSGCWRAWRRPTACRTAGCGFEIQIETPQSDPRRRRRAPPSPG